MQPTRTLPTEGQGMSNSSLGDFQTRFPSSTADVAGAQWAWRDTDPQSDRIPVVFLPGAGGTGDVFYRSVQALQDSRRVITIRYPALPDIDAIVSGLAGLMERIGVRYADVAASSLGGYVAQALAIEHPSLIRRVLFGNSFFDASWLQAKLSRDALLATPSADHLARTVAQLEGLPEDTPEQLDYKTTMLALAGPEQTGDMARAALAAVLGSSPLPRQISLPARSRVTR